MLAHLLLSAWFAVSLGQSVQHVLDLTRREDVTPTPQGVTGGGSGCARGASSGIGPKSADVIVTLLPLPQPEYFVGGHIVFDVIINYAGAGPVEFPWNQMGDFPVSDTQSLVEARLSFRAMDNTGRSLPIAAIILQGNRERPGSIRPLQPGESVRVRVPGWVTAQGRDLDALTAGDRRPTELSAVFSLSPKRCVWTRSVRSEAVATILRTSK